MPAPALFTDGPTTLPRSSERMAIVSLLLVFLCGSVAGAMAMSFWLHPGLHGSRPTGGLTMSVTEWKQQLDLTEERMWNISFRP